MGGAQVRVAGLLAQERLEREVRLVHENPARLVRYEEVIVLVQDGDAVRALGDGGGGVDDPGDRHDLSGAEAVAGHPDGLPVDAHDARVDLLLGGALGDAEPLREEVLQGRAVLRTRDLTGHGPSGGMLVHAPNPTTSRAPRATAQHVG